MFSYTLSRSRKHTNAKPSSEFKLPRGNLILRDGTTTNQSRAARRRGKLNDIYKVYIIISEILMILVQISLRIGLRSALTLSKLKKNSGGACPQTPLVGAASPLRSATQLHPLFKIPGYATVHVPMQVTFSRIMYILQVPPTTICIHS